MLKRDFNKVAKQLVEITLRHGCSPVNLLCIFRTPFPKNISGGLISLKKYFETNLQNGELYDCHRKFDS